MVSDLVRKHLCVAHRVQSKERLGEARREGGLRLSDTLLSTRHLGGVTRDEVEHGLLGVKLGDWWQNTASVASEEDDVGWVAGRHARNLGVLDVLDRVCAASVLGKSSIVVVNDTSGWVENDVLQDGSELDGVEDIGLLLCRQANALGVATALDVEHTLVTPAVLVITDQRTLGVRREGRLASTGQTEEDSNIAVLALICRGVQGQDVVLDRHFVEEDRENALQIVSFV